MLNFARNLLIVVRNKLFYDQAACCGRPCFFGKGNIYTSAEPASVGFSASERAAAGGRKKRKR